MATFILKAINSADPSYSIEYELDGSVYTLSVTYNRRNDSWYCSIFDVDQRPVLQGQKIVVDGVINRFAIGTIPGALLALSIDLSTEDPGIDDLGTRVITAYLESENG